MIIILYYNEIIVCKCSVNLLHHIAGAFYSSAAAFVIAADRINSARDFVIRFHSCVCKLFSRNQNSSTSVSVSDDSQRTTSERTACHDDVIGAAADDATATEIRDVAETSIDPKQSTSSCARDPETAILLPLPDEAFQPPAEQISPQKVNVGQNKTR